MGAMGAMGETGEDERRVVCVGFPVFHADRYLDRLRAVGGVEVVVLPIDPDGDWASVAPSEPHSEPPPWAVSVAEDRRTALARAEVLVALHAPGNLRALAPNLRWIQGVGAGMEQFARAVSSTAGLVVTNASGTSSTSIAEWVVGRLLQVWKRFREADAHQREHAFVRTYGRTLQGSTIGIVGLGHIGSEVSRRLRPFGCRVLASRRRFRPGDVSEDADELFGPDDLHAMLARCDAVVVAAPATPDTRHLIDAAALAAMPPHAVLVNVARGSLVDEAALAAAVERGALAAAVLDVFDPEPPDPKSPLWDLPGVYVSAHSSVSLDRYVDDVFDLVEDNLRRYLDGQPLRNVVDPAALGFGSDGGRR
jgi:phosphoglycerate dehydrogenase-like enzyme